MFFHCCSSKCYSRNSVLLVELAFAEHDSKNASVFFLSICREKGACSQAFLAETVETGYKNCDDFSSYANESCDEHAVYFRR